MYMGDYKEGKKTTVKEIAVGQFFKNRLRSLEAAHFHVGAHQNLPTKVFPNVIKLVTPFTSVCDL